MFFVFCFLFFSHFFFSGAANCLLQLFVLEQLQKDDINRHVPHEVPFQFEYDEIDRFVFFSLFRFGLISNFFDFFLEQLF